MLDKSTFSELEALFAKSGTNTDRTIRMAKGLRILMELVLFGLAAVKLLWESGFGSAVQALPNETSPEPVSGYTRRWWKTAQAIFNIFAVVMNISINKFPSLVFMDGEGNIVTDADGSPVRPFALFDPAELGILGNQTVTKFTPSDPEVAINISVD